MLHANQSSHEQNCRDFTNALLLAVKGMCFNYLRSFCMWTM